MSKQDEFSEGLNDLIFGVRRSIRYHKRRFRFIDIINKTIKIFTCLAAVGTITTLLSQLDPVCVMSFASLAAFSSLFDVVVNTGSYVRLHSELAYKFVYLEIEILEKDPKDIIELNKLIAKRLELEAEEPPILRNLDVLCHNELTKAMGFEEEEEAKLGPFQALFANIIDIRPCNIRKSAKKN